MRKKKHKNAAFEIRRPRARKKKPNEPESQPTEWGARGPPFRHCGRRDAVRHLLRNPLLDPVHHDVQLAALDGAQGSPGVGGGGLVTGELQLLGWPLPGRWTLPFTADDALGGRHTRTTGGKRKQGIREEGAGPLKLWAHRTNGPAHSFAKTESPALEKNSKKNKNNATSCAAFGKKKMNNAKKMYVQEKKSTMENAERTVAGLLTVWRAWSWGEHTLHPCGAPED